MNRIFLVTIKGKHFLFSEDKFWRFCAKSKTHDWDFQFGELDSNEPFTSPKKISLADFPQTFDLDKVKPLLKYRAIDYGTHQMWDIPFFIKDIYRKYGEKIDWNQTY